MGGVGQDTGLNMQGIGLHASHYRMVLPRILDQITDIRLDYFISLTVMVFSGIANSADTCLN